MSIADDLCQLEQLRNRGSLSADEFERAKQKLLATPAPAATTFETINGLRRSTTDRWIGGVCAGLATATGVGAWLWRMAFALLLIAGGSGLLAYLVLWFFVPPEPTPPPQRAL